MIAPAARALCSSDDSKEEAHSKFPIRKLIQTELPPLSIIPTLPSSGRLKSWARNTSLMKGNNLSFFNLAINIPSSRSSKLSFNNKSINMASQPPQGADPSTLPVFESTAIGQIQLLHGRLQETFRSNKTKDLEYRLVQLRRLYWSLKDNTPLIIAALKKDLSKAWFECLTGEIEWVTQEVLHAISKLKSWAKEEKWSDVPLQYKLLNARIRKDPIGVGLIIGAYNYPLQIALGPLVGAIAAGCPAVVKPSETTPATAMAIHKVVTDVLDPDAYAVVNGAVPETTALLDLKWDKIVFTGGTAVGTIIAKKAAETLTPVVLELGGRNPAFVTRNADLHIAARRLLWTKVNNAGQLCISQNYVLVEESVLEPFINELKKTYNTFYPEGAKKSTDWGRIVNKRHFQRIKKMVDDSQGKIVLGGDMDEENLFIEPTVVQVDSITDSMMAEESFGPPFALMAFKTLKEATEIANKVDPTPLGLYVFGSKAEQTQILDSCLSGGASMNDGFFHGAIGTLPFGGVGTSGYGQWHGKASFDSFSHHRTIITTPSWMDRLLRVRYPPYDFTEYKRLTKSYPRPNFDRSGRVISGGLLYWLKLALGLGGKSTKGDEYTSNGVDGVTEHTPEDASSSPAKNSGKSEQDAGVPKNSLAVPEGSQRTAEPLSRVTTAA